MGRKKKVLVQKIDLSNLTYDVGGRQYPRCILGGDRFLDWFVNKPPQIQLTTKYTAKMMFLSYELGIRGFDISCRYNLIAAFKLLKERYPEAIGIGNPNWICGYKLNGIDLIEIKDRILLTIFQKLSKENQSIICRIPKKYRREMFPLKKNVHPLTQDEIREIYIDKQIWLNRITTLRELAIFCLVGADYADWMCMLNRLDLLRWQIETIRKNGMIPVSISHWASLSLQQLNSEAFNAHWVLANRGWMFLDFKSAIDSIKKVEKPITAFRILTGIKLPEEIDSTIAWLKSFGVKSVVVGVENPQQAKITIPKAIASISSELL